MKTELVTLSSIKSWVIEKVFLFISSRFSSLNTHAVLKVRDHKNWPENVQQLATYGEADLHTLLEHFQSPLEKKECDILSAEQEWANMKLHVFNHLKMLQHETLWQKMLMEQTNEYTNILMLVEIILFLPMSTACCERGFSEMKRAKNDWRSSPSKQSSQNYARRTIYWAILCRYGVITNKMWNQGERSQRPNFQRT